MNKIFKVIWNPATGNFTVASETAKGRGKKSGRRKLLVSALVAGGLMSSFGASASVSLDGGTYSDGTELTDAWIAIGKGAKASSVGGSTASISIGVNAISAVGATAVGYDSHATGQSSVSMGQLSTAAGSRGVAIGSGASAAGDYTVALAVGSSASGESAVAIGQGSAAQKKGSVALGHKASSSGEKSVALGASSKATGDDSLALGRNALGNGTGSIAMGAESEANGLYSLAFGANSIADADNTVALGYGASATKAGAMVFGQAGKADGLNSIALGNKSQASSENSIAIGQESYSGSEKSIAIGSLSNVTGVNSVALGTESTAAEDNTVSVGNDTLQRKIVHMAKGDISSTSTDAINGSQLYDISKSVADRLGGGASVSTAGVVNAPNYKLQSGNFNNVGDALKGIDDNTLQWDSLKKVYSAEHGSDATSTITNVKDGALSASSTDAVNGSQLKTTNDNVATNTTNITNLTGDVANNTTNITNLTNDVAANTTSITNLTDTVTNLGADALAWDDASGAFTAAHGTDATSKITNVKDGDLTTDSTDAVNGSQLKTTNDNVATNTTNITNLTGDVANNTTNITNLTNDVAANTTSITNLTDTVTNLGEDALKWDDASGVFTAAHGTDATSKITNVKDGDLTTDSTDAVNGSQLKTTNDNVATNTTNITNLTGDVANNTTNITNLTNDVAANTTSITNLTDTVTNLGADALAWDDASGAFTAAHGTDATSKITNVKDGDLTTDSTDAVNGSQLKTTNDNVATNTTNITNLTGDVANNTTNITNLTNDVAANTTSITNLTDTVTNLGEDALKWDDASGVFTAAHGTNATSKITNVTAGTISSTSTDAVNGGQLFSLSDSLADYFGGNASVDENGVFTGPSYTIGSNSYDSVGDALAAINTSFSTSLGDALLWDETASAFSAGHGGNASKITNVANGAISETSTDAINGGQLYGVSNSVVDALGGNATVNADGSISAPTYSIANTDYNNVGDALDAIDSTLDDALLWDATAGENGAFSASRDGKASVITNVANGDISETSTDAINGSQLFATNTLINQQNEIINQIAGNTSETYIEENGAGLNYVRTNDTGLTFIDASASGTGATAVGYNAAASGESSVAIGQNSSSTVDTGIALGSSSVSSRVIAKSSRETSVTEDGVVIGYDTTDGELLGALSIGDDGKYRQIINVADGTEAHDAVTVRQLQNAIGAVTTTPTKYYHANSTEEDSLAVGTDSLAMGAKTIVNADAGIGIGLNTLVMADAINGIAIGSNARANHANSIAMGNGSQTTRGAQTDYTAYNMDTPQNSVGEFSVGSEDGQRQITNVAAGSADTDAVNVGQLKVTDAQVSRNTQSITNLNTQVSNLDTRVTNIENGIGDIVTTGSTKYFKTNTDGADANAQGADSVAIGSGSIAAAENSVALGTNSVADEANTVSVGSSTQQRRITNVAAGVNNTDAVNVAQLKASEAGSVRYETNADGSVNYSVLNLGDGSGGTTRIGNVSAAVNDTDAVNYAQLKRSVEEANTYTDQKMGEMNSKIKGVENKMSGGIASAMAMAGLPQAYAPGANMTSIAGGTFNGESAVAIGVSMVSESGGWVYKLQGTSNSQGDYSAAIGAGFQW
ncbi:YadA-like family protein [Salmonella enterica]|nr:YadA-like family protein [Salmonella enterica]ASG09947.1 adhesin [Salmonella enterica subsp. enterica serovar Ouakam str. SA20034636]UXC41847.1 YadA-like family protein [Salmonella enterica]